MTSTSARAKSADELQVFIEERNWLLEMGWDDRRIAQRLGYRDWESYLRVFQRHPEIGPIRDPERAERERYTELLRAIGAHRYGRPRTN